MEWLDIIIIFIILGSFLLAGLYQSKLNISPRQYFLGGQNTPWLVAMFSIVATETSVLTFISIPGLAYRGDWFFLQLAIGYIFGRVLVSIFLLPMYFNEGVISVYEIIGKKFGEKIQKTASAIFLITRVFADGIRFLATAVIVQVITDWPLFIAVLIIGIITLIYTLLGGIKTVMWVDSFQFILYLFGGIIIIFLSISYIDEPILAITSSLIKEGKLSIFNFNGNLLTDPYYFISAIVGGILLSFSSHGVDHMMVQRVLSTKNISSAKKAMIGSGFFVFIQFVIFLFAGSLIFYLLKGIPLEQDRELTFFIVNYLPMGIKGILLAGVLSAAMSTLSSSINSLASSTAADWFNKMPGIQKSQLISLAWGLVLIMVALVFNEGDTAIVIIGLQIASFTYGGLLGLFLMTKINQSFHPNSLIIGLLGSLLIVFYLNEIGLAWTWFIGVSAIFNIVLSLFVQNFFYSLKR